MPDFWRWIELCCSVAVCLFCFSDFIFITLLELFWNWRSVILRIEFVFFSGFFFFNCYFYLEKTSWTTAFSVKSWKLPMSSKLSGDIDGRREDETSISITDWQLFLFLQHYNLRYRNCLQTTVLPVNVPAALFAMAASLPLLLLWVLQLLPQQCLPGSRFLFWFTLFKSWL